MVAGFLIQTISTKADVQPTICYWEPYIFVANQEPSSCEDNSMHEKQALNYILSRVQTEYSFRKECEEQTINNSNTDEEPNKVKSEQGIFRVCGHEFLRDESRVLWRSGPGCAFVLLLFPGENILLAELVIAHLSTYVSNSLNLGEDLVKQVIACPDKVASVTHVFLPAGQLLVMNHRVVKQLEKDLEKINAGKV